MLHRYLKPVFVAATAAAGLVSCRPETEVAPVPSLTGLSVLVDSVTYHLHPAAGGYDIKLAASVLNETDHNVYLAAGCPSYFLKRADSTDKTQLYLGQYVCSASGQGMPKPVVVPPGQRFSKAFRFAGDMSPQARPRITIDNNIGTLVFGYGLTDSAGSPRGRVQSAAFQVVPAVYDSVLPPSSVITLPDRRTIEVIGLRKWTIAMLQDSLSKYAPSDSLQSHACAAVLRYKLHFADASSTTFTFDGAPDQIVVSVREPQDSARVHYRQIPFDTLPPRKDWSSIADVFRQHPNVFWPELTARVSFSYPKPSYRSSADSAIAREFNSAISSLSRDADRTAALEALQSDPDGYDRIAAVVILSNFLRQDDTWWALVDALREVDGPVKSVAATVMVNSSRNVYRKVDWTPAATSIHAMLDGTSLFVLDDLTQILRSTGVTSRDAEVMIGQGGGEMLFAYLGSKNSVLSSHSRSLLGALNGQDLGDDLEPWRAWMFTLR